MIAQIRTVISICVNDRRDPAKFRLDVLRILFLIRTHVENISQIPLASDRSIDLGVLEKYPSTPTQETECSGTHFQNVVEKFLDGIYGLYCTPEIVSQLIVGTMIVVGTNTFAKIRPCHLISSILRPTIATTL